jgi:TRAP-type C4-dicarboxylate transport system permease large subunit
MRDDLAVLRAAVFTLMLVTYIPALSLWLPALFR